MIDILYVFGAIASIGSAIFAAKKAEKAKEHADRAESQIENQRRISDLSILQSQWDATYQALAGFGPCARTGDLRGADPSVPARTAQDYIEEVRRCSSSLQSLSDLDERLAEAQCSLKDFSGARSGQDLKDKGTLLYDNLSDLNAAIRSALLSTKEKVDLS